MTSQLDAPRAQTIRKHNTDEEASQQTKPRGRVLRLIARLNVGGPARHVAWLTAGLQARGYRSWLITGTVGDGEEDMRSFATAQGVSSIVVPEMGREITPKDLVVLWKIYRLLRRHRPDILHTHTAKAGTVGRLAGMLYRLSTPKIFFGKPRRLHVVHTFHGHVFHSYYGKWKTRFFVWVERILARLATDRIVVISQQQLDEIHQVYRVGRRDQFALVPLGLDLAALQKSAPGRDLRAELKAKDDEILIGIVGRLVPIKHHGLFLEAAAEVVQSLKMMNGPTVRFVIIGDGDQRPALEKLTQELGLRDRVSFLGFRDDPNVFYPGLDIIALTSLNEGTPLTLIEAMAYSRPTIATAVGGVVDLLGPVHQEAEGYSFCERGIRVRPQDPKAFASGLLKLIFDKELRHDFGEAGRGYVMQTYSKDRLIFDIDRLYEELLAPQETATLR